MTQASPDPFEPLAGPRVRADAPESTVFDAELTIRDHLLSIWRGKWIILATMAAVVGSVTVWMKMTDPLYTASMVIAPATDAGTGGLASKLSQFGGLASLAGINLPSDETVSPFAQFNEVVTSVAVAQRLQENYGVNQKVFESSWDAENTRWVPPQGPVAELRTRVLRFFNFPMWTPPSAGALAKFLSDELVKSYVARSGMRRLEFRHEDPEFAVQLLRWIHYEGDELIRELARERTSRQIAYIERKLATVSVSEYRLSLIQLLADQEKQMMMIQVDLPFAARIIEAPLVSATPTFPKPFRFLALGAAVGFFIGVMLLYLIDSLRGRQTLPRESRNS